MHPDAPSKEDLQRQEQDALDTKAALGDVSAFLSNCDIKGAEALKMTRARQFVQSLSDQVGATLEDIRKQLASLP